MMAEISPSHNARDSLGRVADALTRWDGDDPLILKDILGWGWHAVGLLAYLRLQPARQTFDAWIAEYFHEGTRELDVERDAHWEENRRLSLLELVDLLSAVDLPCLKPEFYQGWQDRTSRCRGLREKIHAILGRAIDENQRRQLLLLLAVYHRLIRLPAGVIIDLPAVRGALPALLNLAEMLIDRNSPDAAALTAAIEKCRDSISTH